MLYPFGLSRATVLRPAPCIRSFVATIFNLAHVTEREAQLLREVARAENEEISPRELSGQYDRNYFIRLTEKSLLLRVGRGRYKLYHPLCRLFLKEG